MTAINSPTRKIILKGNSPLSTTKVASFPLTSFVLLSESLPGIQHSDCPRCSHSVRCDKSCIDFPYTVDAILCCCWYGMVGYRPSRNFLIGFVSYDHIVATDQHLFHASSSYQPISITVVESRPTESTSIQFSLQVGAIVVFFVDRKVRYCISALILLILFILCIETFFCRDLSRLVVVNRLHQHPAKSYWNACQIPTDNLWGCHEYHSHIE